MEDAVKKPQICCDGLERANKDLEDYRMSLTAWMKRGEIYRRALNRIARTGDPGCACPECEPARIAQEAIRKTEIE